MRVEVAWLMAGMIVVLAGLLGHRLVAVAMRIQIAWRVARWSWCLPLP